MSTDTAASEDTKGLDNALEDTFPASDPLPPGAAVHAEREVDPPGLSGVQQALAGLGFAAALYFILRL